MGGAYSKINRDDVIKLYNEKNGNILDILLCLVDDKNKKIDLLSVFDDLYYLLLEMHDFQKIKELFQNVTELICNDVQKNGLKY